MKKELKYQHLKHPWKPIWDKNSKILILGSFPSPKSRENGFYYGHPQNIFWKLISDILNVTPPDEAIKSKKDFLIKHRIAIWDTIAECDIAGASDASIKNAVPNDIKALIDSSNISAIFTTGKTSTNLYEKLCYDDVGIHAIYLPSTSPANRALQKKPEFMSDWKKLREFLK